MTPGQCSQLQLTINIINNTENIDALAVAQRLIYPSYYIQMITQALITEQNNTQSSWNCALNSGSMNPVDQTQRSQQYDEQRRKTNIKLKKLSLTTCKVQNLQQKGKFNQLILKAANLPIDITDVQKGWG